MSNIGNVKLLLILALLVIFMQYHWWQGLSIGGVSHEKILKPHFYGIGSNVVGKILQIDNFSDIKSFPLNSNIEPLLRNYTEFDANSELERDSTESFSTDLTSLEAKFLNNLSLNTSNSSAALFATTLPLCPILPPNLTLHFKVKFDYPPLSVVNKLFKHVDIGGRSKPLSCLSRHKVAIIVPYRERGMQLRALLQNIHEFLLNQQLDYGIFIIEQVANQTFNRGKLLNAGFVEASKSYDWQCFVFHDVDLYPEDGRNLYSCPQQPRHLAAAIDKFNYGQPYDEYFGGVCVLTVEQFKKINGFSNDYWGWGGEDDDIAARVFYRGLKVSRYSSDIARYKMVRHDRESSNPVNPCRHSLLYSVKNRSDFEGLSSLRYNLMEIKSEPLFTLIKVDLLEEESKAKLAMERICQ